MLKGQSGEAETLDEKIKRIRKKNEEIEKRRLEVEEDKQTAAKLNALVQLNAPKEDWPLPRAHSPEEERGRKISGTYQEKPRERTRGNVTFSDIDESKRPPPDPAFRFLADSERDPLPPKNLERSQRYTRGRGQSTTRGRGRDFKGRPDMPPSSRGTPGYEAWRAERNRIDEERIRRQRTAQGQWRREWDVQKSEEDWDAPRSEKTRDSNPASNRAPRSNIPPDSPKDVIIKRRTFSEESKDVSSSSTKTPGILGPRLKEHALDDAAAAPVPLRRPIVGSGRVGLPPPAKPRATTASASDYYAGGGGGAQPQRRPREPRPRRRAGVPAPASAAAGWGRQGQDSARGRGRKSSGEGDDSWEDADDHSDEHADADADTQSASAAPPATQLQQHHHQQQQQQQQQQQPQPPQPQPPQPQPLAVATSGCPSTSSEQVAGTPPEVASAPSAPSGGSWEGSYGDPEKGDETVSLDNARPDEIPVDMHPHQKTDQSGSTFGETELDDQEPAMERDANISISADTLFSDEIPVDVYTHQKTDQSGSAFGETEPDDQEPAMERDANISISAEACIVGDDAVELQEGHTEFGAEPPISFICEDKSNLSSPSPYSKKDVYDETSDEVFEMADIHGEKDNDSAVESIGNKPMTETTHCSTEMDISESLDCANEGTGNVANVVLSDGMNKSVDFLCSSVEHITEVHRIFSEKVEGIPDNSEADCIANMSQVTGSHEVVSSSTDEKEEKSDITEKDVSIIDESKNCVSNINSQTALAKVGVENFNEEAITGKCLTDSPGKEPNGDLISNEPSSEQININLEPSHDAGVSPTFCEAKTDIQMTENKMENNVDGNISSTSDVKDCKITNSPTNAEVDSHDSPVRQPALPDHLTEE